MGFGFDWFRWLGSYLIVWKGNAESNRIGSNHSESFRIERIDLRDIFTRFSAQSRNETKVRFGPGFRPKFRLYCVMGTDTVVWYRIYDLIGRLGRAIRLIMIELTSHVKKLKSSRVVTEMGLGQSRLNLVVRIFMTIICNGSYS